MQIRNTNPMFGTITETFEVASVDSFVEDCGKFLKPLAEDLSSRIKVTFDFAYESIVYELLKGLVITPCKENEND